MSTPTSQAVNLPCRDALDRPRLLTLTVHADHLVLHAPPGEVAVLDAAAVVALAAAIRTTAATPPARPQ